MCHPRAGALLSSLLSPVCHGLLGLIRNLKLPFGISTWRAKLSRPLGINDWHLPSSSTHTVPKAPNLGFWVRWIESRCTSQYKFNQIWLFGLWNSCLFSFQTKMLLYICDGHGWTNWVDFFFGPWERSSLWPWIVHKLYASSLCSLV